ncbi:MAG: hypothetical protein RLY78_1166 [Pseudomonadota bacterium]|jgi:rod shape-determining protein MreC|uniref:Cell shape-determining protein MreC n=1 Tax=Pseudaquabacterium rugosum TaxID=2984194 RepID=A0ABU9BFD6_9BURK
MPIATIDRTPPPFFRQGPSALTKLALCSALAVCLMAADTRWNMTQPVRAGLATALLPVQQALLVPVEFTRGLRQYLQGLKLALDGASAARAQLAQLSERAARTEQLTQENQQLRRLLELRPALTVRGTAAELLYVAADPYSRKVFIDRGSHHGIRAGAPVINEAGVLGQVTEVYPLSSVVTLLTDRDAAIPVLNTRTQVRGAAFGGIEGGTALELRYMAANADVQAGDLLSTSGLDGIYPPGLPVARVLRVERRSDAGFARIVLRPTAPIEGLRHVMVLEPVGEQMPPRPDSAASAASAPAFRRGAGASAAAASAPASAVAARPASAAASTLRSR